MLNSHLLYEFLRFIGGFQGIYDFCVANMKAANKIKPLFCQYFPWTWRYLQGERTDFALKCNNIFRFFFHLLPNNEKRRPCRTMKILLILPDKKCSHSCSSTAVLVMFIRVFPVLLLLHLLEFTI